VSPEREQRALESPLAQELTRPNGLLQTVVHGPEQAVEVMRLAARQYRHALRTTPSAVADDDPEQVYVLVYEAIRAAAAALLLANGYRVRGGERSHVQALRLAALGLAAWHPDEARLLERIRPSVTRRAMRCCTRVRRSSPSASSASSSRRHPDCSPPCMAASNASGASPRSCRPGPGRSPTCRRGLSSPGSPRTVRFLSASAG
jgi:hypothetical protein